MANFKCPDCGATLTDDSKFCKYCGAKIDDGVKRVEVNVNKRIEDIAEMRRAEREERESLRREKKEKAATVWKWIKVAIVLIVLCVGVCLMLTGDQTYMMDGFFLILGAMGYTVVTWLHKMLG